MPQAGLKLEQSSCFSFLSSGIAGMRCHIWCHCYSRVYGRYMFVCARVSVCVMHAYGLQKAFTLCAFSFFPFLRQGLTHSEFLHLLRLSGQWTWKLPCLYLPSTRLLGTHSHIQLLRGCWYLNSGPPACTAGNN